jgi:hypothetical protein
MQGLAQITAAARQRETISVALRSASRGPGFRRRDLGIWAAVILFANQLLGVISGTPLLSPGELISQLCAIGIFQYMAWYAIFRLLAASNPSLLARWWDVLIIVALCSLVFLPTTRMVWMAAAGVAVYLVVCNAGDRRMRAAGIVLAALSLQEFWGRNLFYLIAAPLLDIETAAVGTVLQLTRPGAVWHDNIITMPSGHGIVLYPYCSSFHNVSLALLCWVTLTKLRGAAGA